jgi:hypothetical protein
MNVDTQSYDWATHTLVALNDHALDTSPDKWQPFTHDSPFSQSAFSIPPSMLSHGSIERYGQVTPPEDLSPASPRRDSARESSIPLEELKNEALFPDHQLQALQEYQPHSQLSPVHSPPQDEQERSSKRRRTSKASTNHAQQTDDPSSLLPQPEAGVAQPPKRKRGRPKAQPQMVEAYTAEGFPFQVSSARQSHLEKNRVAAHKCRMRKKDYINGLEERARIFTTKNKALKENVAMLREEVLELKNEVLRHAGCGFWAVDEYLARCAGDLLGMKPPPGATASSGLQQSPSPTLTTLNPEKMNRLSSVESMHSSVMDDSPHHDDYSGFDLLEDMDEKVDISQS